MSQILDLSLDLDFVPSFQDGMPSRVGHVVRPTILKIYRWVKQLHPPYIALAYEIVRNRANCKIEEFLEFVTLLRKLGGMQRYIASEKGEFMSDRRFEKIRDLWDHIADDWQIQVGHEGDRNRMLNSDPVLWKFAGDVRGLTVLDAGCGTGYLSKKLQDRGARVTGVDFSEKMVAIALANYTGIDFRVDSCSGLRTISDQSIDLIVSNYVLMDTPDLPGTMQSFNRVLKNTGAAVLIFSHPCFPAGRATAAKDRDEICYSWRFSYFDQVECTDPPWGHFTSEFIWHHRPLSDYWKEFQAAGFTVTDFEEPRIAQENYSLAESEKDLKRNQSRPYSVAFKLDKKQKAL